MTDFKIRRGLSTDLFINGDNKAGVIDGVVLENGCWYLCTDTADLFLCVQQTNGLTLKRINEKAGWDITIDGDTIDASVIIALRAEVDNIKESLNDYAKTSDIPSLEDYATKEFVVDAIDRHEALATVEEVKTKLETEVLPIIPTVQETILPTVQKVETEILPTVQELAEKTATQEWVAEKNFATESFVTDAVSIKADKDHAHDNYADKDHLHEQYLTEHQSLDHKADKAHSHEEYLTEHQDLSHLAAKEHAHEEYALASHRHDEYLTEHQDISGKADISYVRDNYAAKDHLHEQYLTEHQNLDHKANVDHTHEEYLTELPAHTHDEYLKELPEHTHSEYLTELPKHFHEEYLTELPEHTHSEYLTELPKHTHEEYLTKLPEHSHEEYLTELPSHEHSEYLTEQSLAGYATQDWVNEQGFAKASDIPAVSDFVTHDDIKDFISDIPSEYVTEDELTKKGYITDISGKADNVLFTTDKYVTTAFGGFVVGNSLKDLTIAQILTTLLGLSDKNPNETDEPDEPDEPVITENVTIEDIKTYSIPVIQGAAKNGEITIENAASAFSYLELNEAEAEAAPQAADEGTAILYEIKDSDGTVTESGYQIYTIATGRGNKLRVALAKGLTTDSIKMFDEGTNKWVTYELSFTATGESLTYDGYPYEIYESEGIGSGEVLRFILK